MKKNLLLAVAAIACSCSPDTTFSVRGTFAGAIEGDTLSLVTYDRAADIVAQGVVGAESSFEIIGDVEEPQMVVLTSASGERAGVLFLEAGDIVVEQSDGEYIFSGTYLNDANNSLDEAIKPYFDSYAKLTDEDSQQARDSIINGYNEFVSQTITQNLDNIFGANLFANIEFSELTAEQAKSRIAEFAEQIQSSDIMQEISRIVEAMLNTEIGDKYINIDLPNREGESVSVESLLATNKYILIDFWATWCAPCRAEMPHLKEAYEAYHSKGFEIYGVSVDQNQAAWESFVGEDMPWVNVIMTEGSDAAEQYAVRTIPSNFLIDQKGEIVAKNLRGEEVMAKLEELLK